MYRWACLRIFRVEIGGVVEMSGRNTLGGKIFAALIVLLLNIPQTHEMLLKTVYAS